MHEHKRIHTHLIRLGRLGRHGRHRRRRPRRQLLLQILDPVFQLRNHIVTQLTRAGTRESLGHIAHVLFQLAQQPRRFLLQRVIPRSTRGRHSTARRRRLDLVQQAIHLLTAIVLAEHTHTKLMLPLQPLTQRAPRLRP